MLSEFLILCFCGLVGFSAAAASANLYHLLTAREAAFSLEGRSFLSAFSSLLLFAVTGPAILARLVWQRRGDGPALLTVWGIAIALLWSVCSGLVVLQFAVSIGNGLA